MPLDYKEGDTLSNAGGKEKIKIITVYKGKILIEVIESRKPECMGQLVIWTFKSLQACGWVKYIEPRKEYWSAYKRPSLKTEYYGPYKEMPTVTTDQGMNPNYMGVLVMTHHSETEVTVEFIANQRS